MVTNAEGGAGDGRPTPSEPSASPASPASPAPAGRLVLIPNTLDLGSGHEVPIDAVVPLGALRRAAGLRHWVVENAKSARAFLKRVDAVVPLGTALQSLSIVEMPRPPKGAAASGPGHAQGGHLGGAGRSPWDTLLQPALAGHDIGVLSEAGMPAVADPGAPLVAAAHARGIVVEPWAGPSSLMMALAASGLDGQSFAFVGYLPVDASQRAARIAELERHSRRAHQTQIAIETPYRNAALLLALLQTLAPTTRLSVSAGLSLPGGWSRTDTVERWRAVHPQFAKDQPAIFAWIAG